MTVEFEALHKILKDPTRRSILRILNSKGPLPYVELMELAEITNTGRFNYHLKVLGSLTEKMADGRYTLNERGRLAVQLLDNFPERAAKPRGQKRKRRRLLVAVAVLLLVGIIAVSALLVNMQLQSAQMGFDVVYWKQQPDEYSNNQYVQYLFNVTGTDKTYSLAPTTAINQALNPLLDNYPLETMTTQQNTTILRWYCQYIDDGAFVFTVVAKVTLTQTQLANLTVDLKAALQSTQ